MTLLRPSLAALAVLLLGATAALRLFAGGGTAALSRPAIQLSLRLPEPGDAAEIAERWVVPLEAAARSAPGAGTVTTQVHPDGAVTLVSLEHGTDPERAAARAAAALGALRRSLPDGSSVSVRPLGSTRDRGMVIALRGPDAVELAHPIADALRSLPGLRSVSIDGVPSREIVLQLRGGDVRLARQVAGAVGEARQSSVLGMLAGPGTARPVVIAPVPDPSEAVVALGREPVRAESLAVRIDQRRPAESVAFVDGRRVILLGVLSTHDASLAALDSSVRALLDARAAASDGGLEAEILQSDHDSLRRMHLRLGLSLAAATIAAVIAGLLRGGMGGALRLGSAVPLALAAGLGGTWILGAPLDDTTAPALALAAILAIPPFAARMERAASAGAVLLAGLAGMPVPIALHLAGGSLAPEWATPAAVFATALLLGAAASLIWPPPAALRPRSRRAGRALRAALRDPLTLLLALLTAAAIGLSTFGDALRPGAADARAGEGSLLAVELWFAEGTPLPRSEKALAELQSWLARQPSVRRSWGRATAGSATCLVEARHGRSRGERDSLKLALRHLARQSGASSSVAPAGSSPASELLVSSSEERAETDARATRYRAVLRGTRVEDLLAAIARIREAASRAGVPHSAQLVEWRPPSMRVEVRPRPRAGMPSTGELRAMLQPDQPARTAWPAREPTELVVTWPGAPAPDDPAPQRGDVLDVPRRDGERVVVPAALAEATERSVVASLRRENGRFVVPLTLGLASQSEERRRADRKRLDTALSLVRLPAGCELDRPVITSAAWLPERIRLLALGLALPLVLALVTAFVVGAFAEAGLGLVVPAVGAAAAAAALAASGSRLGGEAFTLAGCALASAHGIGVGLLSRGHDAGAHAKWGALRAARRAMPGVAVLSAAMAALVAACWTLDPVENPWLPALRSAAAAAALASCAALIGAPAISIVLAEARRRRSADASALRRPPAWRDPGEAGHADAPLSLTLRHLSKIHPGGVHALSDVSLHFEPGIIGLLGPNGAGKTTLLRCLTGLMAPTRGEVLHRGVVITPANLAEYRRHLGFLPQDFNAHPGMTARQFLEYWAIERGMRSPRARAAEIEARLSEVDLLADADRRVRDFSGGMRQRLGIARALLGSPPVLVVDEPTTGLDVESRTRFRGALLAVASRRLVILSTHVASDVESAASRLVLLHHGRVRFDGSPGELVARAAGRVAECLVADEDLREFSRRYRVTARVRVLAGIRCRAVVTPGDPLPGPAVRPSLEEAYLAELDRSDPGVPSSK